MHINFKQQTERVSFIGVLDTATWSVISIGGATFSAGGIPISSLTATNGQYWVEPDSDGRNQFCTTKTIGSPILMGFFMKPPGIVVSVSAHPFEMIANGQGDDFNLMPKSQD